MAFMSKNKSGMVTTELAITIALVVVVLFVVLGMFSDNVKVLVEKSNLTNIFSNTDKKTEFMSFNKDYTDSQVNVQIMGEQGLETLRRRANNKALALIENPFAESNANASAIVYLASAINSIVGEPSVCVYMKEDSKNLCTDGSIGGYSYKIAISSSALTIQKVSPTGANIGESVVLGLSSPIASLLGSLGTTTNGDSDSYSYIKALTVNFTPYVKSDVLLVRLLDAAVSEASTGSNSENLGALISDINAFAHDMTSVMQDVRCSGLFCGRPSVSSGDVDEVRNWANGSLMTGMNSANKLQEVVDAFKDSVSATNILDSINDSSKACWTFNNGVEQLRVKYPQLDFSGIYCQ